MTKILIYSIVGITAVLLIAFFVGSSIGNSPVAEKGFQESVPSVPLATPATPLVPATTPAAPEVAQSSLGKVPDLAFKDYSGKTVRLMDFAGKPLVVNAWAAWCPFCRQELPDFVQAQKEFGDKVVIVAINRQENLKTAKGYTDAQGTSNDLVFLLDPDDSFYRAIGGFSMPETIFVNKNGEIVIHKRGPMDLQEIRGKIQQIVAS